MDKEKKQTPTWDELKKKARIILSRKRALELLKMRSTKAEGSTSRGDDYLNESSP